MRKAGAGSEEQKKKKAMRPTREAAVDAGKTLKDVGTISPDEFSGESGEAAAETEENREGAAETEGSRGAAAGLKGTREEENCAAEERQELAADFAAAREELQILKEEFESLSDKNLRLAAEYENFRKRSRQEKDELYGRAVMDVSAIWLPVMDNLERATAALAGIENEEAKAAADGVAMVYRQAREILDRLDIKEIDACGATFDPNIHEAVMHIEDDERGAGEIVEVFQKGYMRDDKVLRHSVVKVAN